MVYFFRQFLILCFAAGAATLLQAQPVVKFTTAKNAPEKALKAYNEGRKNMQESDIAGAIRAYKRAIEIDSTFVDAYLYLAGAHFESRHWAEAEQHFEKAIALAPAYQSQAIYVCASAEWEQNKFSECADHAAEYLRFTEATTSNARTRQEAQRLLENARFSAVAVKNPVSFNPETVGNAVNSGYDEYLPAMTADGQTIIFTRREGNDENFYQSHRSADATEWSRAVPLEGVNTTQNEGAESISPDGSWLVFTACDRRDDGSQGGCDLYWSQLKKEVWSKPVPFSATINSSSWDAQPSISADGKTIFFSSDRPGTIGGKDLWFTTRQANGKWSTPENMGADINTTADDQTPFIHPDGQTLYFTSNGLPGLGNNDIYLVRRQTDGTWGKPENIGYPINTKAHEGTLSVSLDGQTAYFAAFREGGAGGLDLYKFDMPVSKRPKPVTYARALVTDAATGYPLVAKVEFTDLITGKSFVTANTKSDGTFLVCLPAGKDYALHVNKDKYLFHSANFNLTESASFSQPFTLNIELQPISTTGTTTATPKPVVLQNVFFVTGSAELQPVSTAELERLVALLNENPTLNIQISGHTDNVGDDKSNLILSEKRAQSVMQFLLEKGIAVPRLKAIGYGETQPMGPNDTAEGRASNRRTEFIIF